MLASLDDLRKATSSLKEIKEEVKFLEKKVDTISAGRDFFVPEKPNVLSPKETDSSSMKFEFM